MMKPRACLSILLLGGVLCASCTDYTPKPRGYFRIEPAEARYEPIPTGHLPYQFDVSHLAIIEQPDKGNPTGWLNVSYPALEAKIYCSYLPITSASFGRIDAENRDLVARQSRQAASIREKAYENPEQKVFGSLFLLEGESASPIQFALTDSVSHFFRGSLHFDCKMNADSLAPAIEYLQKDIIELMQTFRWK